MKALTCLLLALASSATIARGGENGGLAAFRKYAATLPSDEQVQMRLEIYRRVGIGEVDLSKPRISVTLRRSILGKGSSARVRFDVMKPTSMAGIAMTAAWDPKTRKHQVLRFLPGNSALRSMGYLNSSFLQSHLNYEDVVPLAVEEYAYSAKGEKKVGDTNCQVIEARPKRPSSYARLVYYLRKSDNKAAKVEYYTRGYRGPELKKTRILKTDDREEWTTAKTKEKTVVRYSDRKAEAPAEARFKPESLKTNPSMIQLMKERSKLLEREDKLRREIARLKLELDGFKTGAKSP